MPKEFEIWAEKYRPKTFDEIINQENAVERVRVFAKSKNIPHMLFAGPPGTGKCVEKGSLIFTLEGLKNVEEINEGEKVLSLDPDGKLNFRKVKGVTEREDKIYWVKTRSGSRIGVTIEHPFLALENGLPTWKSVKELKEGDFIASIREFNLENEKALDFSRVENLFVKVEREIMVEVEKLFDGKKREIIKILTNSPLSFDEICERGNIKRGTAREMLRQLKKEGVIEKSDKKYVLVKRKIAAKILPISATTNLQRNEIKAISVKTKNGFSVWIKPFEDDEDFYEWLGYILSEGDIDNSMIIFYNKNKALLARFARLTRKIFGLQPEIGNNYVKIKCGVTLTRILSTLFDVYVGKKKSYHIKVPTRLFSGKREKAARFIRAYFDGDGSFYDNQIEIASNSKEMLLGIKTLLLKFGIISQVYSRRLLISGLEQVKKFVKEIGSFTKKFVITVKKENTNKDVLPFAAKHVKFIMDKLGLTYKDLVKNKKELEYLFERGRGSYKKVKRIYKILLKESRKKIIELLKTLDELELIASLDKTQLEKDIKEIFYMLLDIKLRKELEKLVRIRYDRLLEYSQGKRKPSIFSFLKIVEVLMHLRKIDEETYSRIRRISFVLDVLKSAFRVMNVSYNSVCSYEIHPATLAFDLREKVTSIKSAISLISIAKRLKEKMISIISNEELITTLELLDFLVNTEIFWDRIKNIEEKGYGKVYDLEIEGSHNFVGGNGLILHNTTLALVLARELYGNQWGQNVLQLNASVSKDTPILVRVDGKIKRTTFEELDSIYFKNEKEVYKNAENLEVLTVDNNLKVKWVKVSKIIRHKAEKILKVKLEGGGEIKLTGNHSVMVLDENGLKSKAASELREGEYLISFISKIKTDSTIPTNNFKASNLFYAFGLFTAEGCVGFRNNTSGQVVYTFGIHETNLVHEIKNFANELGINVYENLAGSGFNRNRLSAIHLKPLNTQLERFMKDNFYDGIAFSAENKRVPTFVFGSSIKERVDYLKGLADGDGSGKLGNVVRISSVSKDLLIDTVWLARISGIEASIFKGEARLIWKVPMKWKKGDLLPADLMIKLITKIEKRIKGNWRYKLRHQLYDKRKRVSKRIVKEILQMVERDLLKEEEKEVFKLLEKFIFSDLHVLKIKKIEIIDYDDFVYDVSVPNNEMFFAGNIPILLHNSDERGIDVIRGQVKEFARTVAIGDVPFRLIIMDEADAMTSDAQQALRRMMEMYASVSRFILIANYSSKIIEPIQSRCAVFRFKALDDKHVEEFVNRIVEGEKLKISEDGIKAVVRIAEGDLRKAANILQAASALKEKITEDVVYEAASLAKPQEVKEMLELALKGKFIEAKKMLEEMIIKKGLAGSDIVAEIHRQIPTLSIDDRAKVELIEKCGEVDFRISEGANELIQLESLLASFLLYAQFKGKK